MTKKLTSRVLAAREHLLEGNLLTRIEALILFGVPDLTKIISDLRKEGYVVKKREVPYLAVLTRVNRQAVLQPPANLPIKEIVLTEYWVNR